MPTFPGTPATNDTNAVAKFTNALVDAGYVTAAGVDSIGALYDVVAISTANSAPDALLAAGAISINTRVTSITGPAASTYAVTLAAPATGGIVKVITMVSTTSTNAVTLALTNVVGGSAATSASFDAAGETLVLVSGGPTASPKWIVLKEYGVTLS